MESWKRRVTAAAGPNGTIEVKQRNMIQGWHSGYASPAEARELAAELMALAEKMEGS